MPQKGQATLSNCSDSALSPVALRAFELGMWLGSPKGGERKHGMGGNTTHRAPTVAGSRPATEGVQVQARSPKVRGASVTGSAGAPHDRVVDGEKRHRTDDRDEHAI